MRHLGAWWVRLAMAGSCVAWAGCGRSDVPDPDSDSAAAAEQSAKIVDKSAEAPAAAEAATPTPAEAPAPAAVAVKPKEPTSVAAAEADKPAAAPAEEDKPAAAAKGDASGTEDLARLAAAPPAADPGNAAAATTNGSPAPSGVAPGPAGMPMGISPAAAGSPPPGDAPTRPGGRIARGGEPGAPAEGGMTLPGAAGPGAMAPGGMGMAGDVGGDLGSVSKMGNAAFNHPTTAVTAFLAALKSKDKDRLSQATARRAAVEADVKHQKIFAAIIEQSISDEELDDMSQALDGFRVIGQLPFKSTGKVGVMVAKQSGRDTLRRTLQVRKEKEGWKVMDIESMYDFKPGLPPMFRGGRGRKR